MTEPGLSQIEILSKDQLRLLSPPAFIINIPDKEKQDQIDFVDRAAHWLGNLADMLSGDLYFCTKDVARVIKELQKGAALDLRCIYVFCIPVHIL